MKYPAQWRTMINTLGFGSGCLSLVIASLSVMEAILRYFFHRPTGWSLNLSEYCLIYLVYMASAYAFQEGGHVAVDMLRNAADRFDKTGKQIPRRAMAVLGYLMALFFICVMFYGAWELFQKSIVLNRLSTLSPQIPMWILYLPMMIGSVFMAITLVFMILDCLSQDSDGKYL